MASETETVDIYDGPIMKHSSSEVGKRPIILSKVMFSSSGKATSDIQFHRRRISSMILKILITYRYIFKYFQETKRKSSSLFSVHSDTEVIKHPEHILTEDENGLNLAIPKIKRRRSIDVSKIENLVSLPDLDGMPSLVTPSITISQYNSNVGLNRSMISLNEL